MYVRESYLLLMGVYGGRVPSVYFCRQRGKDYEQNTVPLIFNKKIRKYLVYCRNLFIFVPVFR